MLLPVLADFVQNFIKAWLVCKNYYHLYHMFVGDLSKSSVVPSYNRRGNNNTQTKPNLIGHLMSSLLFCTCPFVVSIELICIDGMTYLWSGIIPTK